MLGMGIFLGTFFGWGRAGWSGCDSRVRDLRRHSNIEVREAFSLGGGMDPLPTI
jgi:hypothetical protein